MAFRIGRKFAYHTYPEPNNAGAIVSNRQEGTLFLNQSPLEIQATGPSAPAFPFDVMGVVIKPTAGGIGDFTAVVAAYFFSTITGAGPSSVRFQLVGIQGTAGSPLLINGVDPAVGFYQAQPGSPPTQPIVFGAGFNRVLLDTGGTLIAPNAPLVEQINMAVLPASNQTQSLPPAGSPPVPQPRNFPAASGKVWFGLRVFAITGNDVTFGFSPAGATGGPIATCFAQEVG